MEIITMVVVLVEFKEVELAEHLIVLEEVA
jgi:hypothetical protein